MRRCIRTINNLHGLELEHFEEEELELLRQELEMGMASVLTALGLAAAP